MNMRLIYVVIGIIHFVWCAYIFIHFSDLPAKIPTHFNASGEVDGWGSRAMIWLLPVIGFFTSFFVLVVPQYTKDLINYPVKLTDENRERQYQLVLKLLVALAFIVLGLFITISVETVQIALSSDADQKAGLLVWIFLGLMFIVFGWYIARAKQLK